jgi:signal transduction histidine kinase
MQSLPARVARVSAAIAAKAAGTRSPTAFLFFGVSLAFYAALVVNAPGTAATATGSLAGAMAPALHRGGVTVLALLSVLMLVASREQSFDMALGMHVIVSILLATALPQPDDNLLMILVTGLLPLCVYERFPLSLLLAAGYGAIVVFICALAGYGGTSLLFLALTGSTVALAGSLMGRHREAAIELQKYVSRLEDNVASLTRANSLSQDYARGVEEESRVAERLRLTRDIHDSIGYVMTSTIMAMEAAKVMAKSEPERVSSYLETTRAHAAEGFAHVRRVLRDFRSQQPPQDSCFVAIKKLVKVVALSSGVTIRFEFGNLDVAALDPFAEAAYHFVQEGLINAFRHGHARNVVLLFWDFGDCIRVTLDDDGAGSGSPPSPGIGLNGMIERAAAHAGKVVIERYAQGFRISMILSRDRHAARA